MQTIDSDTLNARLAQNTAPIILDILPDEHFERSRLPNAFNACVYEIEFLEKTAALCPDKSTEIVVYGLSDAYEASQLTYEKLSQSGWERVFVLVGGLEGWIANGLPTQGNGEAPSLQTGRFEANIEKSVVRWVGRNLLNQHNGTIGLESAHLILENGNLVGGEATLDMNAIVCVDIEDSEMASMLIGHLRTDDFFLVDSYPTSHFSLSSVEAIENVNPGSPNCVIKGVFTLRGHSEPIEFIGTLGSDDASIALQAQFDIDRVLWNSKYGSGRIYEALGKHVVNDLISISFQLIAPAKS